MSLATVRYARALFEVAESKGATDAVAADLAAIGEIVADDQVAAVVLRGEASGSVRRRAVEKIGEGRHELVRNLLGVLERRRRLELLGDLPETFAGLVRRARGTVVGVAEAAQPLTDEQLRGLEALAGKLSGKTVELGFRHEPGLMGGVRLRLGNTLYDGSVKTRLEDLRRRMLAAPLV